MFSIVRSLSVGTVEASALVEDAMVFVSCADGELQRSVFRWRRIVEMNCKI